jgi:hypothetical protein
VRSDTEFRPPVHLVGADLHLERLARQHDGGVQRLVEVELG